MNRAILSLFAVAALVAVPAAAAQSGPAPGYDDPLLYARDYAEAQAGEATADPAGFAADHASRDAIVNETAHAAYMACWTADSYADFENEVCDDFYVAAQEAAPLPEETEAEEAAEDTVDAAEELADELTGSLDDLLADPTSAPTVAERIVGAVADFAESVGTTVVGLVIATAQGVIATVEDLTDGIGAANAAGSGVLGDLAGGFTAATGEAAGMVGGATGAVTDAVTGATSTATETAVDAAQGLVEAIGDNFARAGELTKDTAAAVADAVESLAESIQETVSSWFGGSGTSSRDSDRSPVRDVEDTAGGLVDDVLGLLS